MIRPNDINVVGYFWDFVLYGNQTSFSCVFYWGDCRVVAAATLGTGLCSYSATLKYLACIYLHDFGL
jgi:hypothetical protein